MISFETTILLIESLNLIKKFSHTIFIINVIKHLQFFVQKIDFSVSSSYETWKFNKNEGYQILHESNTL